MDEIKVSVIMPVYNASKYLRQCIDSVLNQTLKEIEVICVDDSSTDDSLEILREYEKKDSRVIALTQPNSTAGAARNNGMSIARGEYYSILDSDDFFEPTMLEAAYNKAEKVKADIVCFGSNQYYNETGEYEFVEWVLRTDDIPPFEPFNRRQLGESIYKVFVGWAWDKLFSAEFVKKHDLKFQVQRTSNDMYFVFSALALAERMAVVDRVFVHQRKGLGGSLSNTREKSWHCFHDGLMAVKQRLVDEGLFAEMEKDWINYCLHFSFWNLNTIAGKTYELLFNKLKTEWFTEFGITGKPQSYFYNQSEYRQYQQVMENDFESYVKLRKRN